MRDCRYLGEFNKEYVLFTERFHSLKADFDVVIDVLSALHTQGLDVSHISRKLDDYSDTWFAAYEMHKVACKDFNGKGANSGLNIIYVYDRKMRGLIFCELFDTKWDSQFDTKRLKSLINELRSR